MDQPRTVRRSAPIPAPKAEPAQTEPEARLSLAPAGLPDCLPRALESAEGLKRHFGLEPPRLVRLWGKNVSSHASYRPEQAIAGALRSARSRHEIFLRLILQTLGAGTRGGSNDGPDEGGERFFTPGFPGHALLPFLNRRVAGPSGSGVDERLAEALPPWACDPDVLETFRLVRNIVDAAQSAWNRLGSEAARGGDPAPDDVAVALWTISALFGNDELLRAALRYDPGLKERYQWAADPSAWIANPPQPEPTIAPALMLAYRSVQIQTGSVASDPYTWVFSSHKNDDRLARIQTLWSVVYRIALLCSATAECTLRPLILRLSTDICEGVRESLAGLESEAVAGVLDATPPLAVPANAFAAAVRRQTVLWEEWVRRSPDLYPDDLEKLRDWKRWVENRTGEMASALARFAASTRDLSRTPGDVLEYLGAMSQTAPRLLQEGHDIVELLRTGEKEATDWSRAIGSLAAENAGDSAPRPNAGPAAAPPLQDGPRPAPDDDREDLRRKLQAERLRNQRAGRQIERLRSEIEELRRRPTTGLESTETVLGRIPETPNLSPLTALTVAVSHRPLLRVLDSGWTSARKAEKFRHGRRLLELLLLLGGEYATALLNGQSDAQARAVFGQDAFKAHESEGVICNGEARQERTFVVDGQKVLMERHLAIGTAPNPAETLRVYFDWRDGRIVIGHCGEHLKIVRKP